MDETVILVDDAPATVPYSFARKHGVLLRAGPAGLECVHRGDVGLDALLEVQRIAPGATYVAVSDEAFDAALSAVYSGSAAPPRISISATWTLRRSPSAPRRSTICSTRATMPR